MDATLITRMYRNRLRTGFLTVLFTGVMVLTGLSQAVAGDLALVAPGYDITIPESRDFATERFADPWDMSKYTDLSFGQYFSGLADTKWQDGIFSARSTGYATTHPLFAGIDGVYFNGRDGYLNRIATTKFNRFSVRMRSSRQAAGQLFWFYNQTWSDSGVTAFQVEPGWHTYIIDPTLTGRWTGRPMGLRFDPTNEAGVDLQIDWMRLYKQTSRRVEIVWTDRKPSGQTEIYLDFDRDPTNKNSELLGARTSAARNSYLWDPSPYEARSYYFYIKRPGEPGIYSKRVTVNRAPLTRLLDPDEQGGKDYAATEFGDPWDMGQPSDVWYWLNMTDVTFSNGVMSGSPVNGDSHFHLRVPKTIDPDKYHRLTFRFKYDGPFDYGGGTMTRFIWSADHNKLELYQTINDIVTYPTWQTYTVDLKEALLDRGTTGWNGPINDFRFNPLEGDRPPRFHIDYIKLKADDEADKSFIIKWRDGKSAPRRTLVNLFYDTDKSGFNGTLIAANRLQAPGVNKYAWNTSSIAPGKYYIYAVARDGINVTKTYSSGPLLIAH